MTFEELTLDILRVLIPQTGARDWGDYDTRQTITNAAMEMAANIIANGEFFMPTKILTQEMDGTPKQICFADHATDFNPTAANDLRKTTDGSQETDVQLDLTDLANGNGTTTGARQSAKFDFGENRAALYNARAAFEIAPTPTAGNVIELWLAPSSSATAGTGNPGGVSGSDAAYTGYANNNVASMKQLIHIGDFICTTQATATVQVGEVGAFSPPERYGSLIVYDTSGAALHSDAVESHIVFDPIIDEFQN